MALLKTAGISSLLVGGAAFSSAGTWQLYTAIVPTSPQIALTRGGYAPLTTFPVAKFEDGKDFKEQTCFNEFTLANSSKLIWDESTDTVDASVVAPTSYVEFDDAGHAVQGCLLSELKYDDLNTPKKGRVSLKTELVLMEPSNKYGLGLWTYLTNKGDSIVEKAAMVWLEQDSSVSVYWAIKDGFRWEYTIDPPDSLKFDSIQLEKGKLCPNGSSCGTSWSSQKKDYRFFRDSGTGNEKAFDRLNPTGFWDRFKEKMKTSLTHQYKSNKWQKVTSSVDASTAVEAWIKPFPINSEKGITWRNEEWCKSATSMEQSVLEELKEFCYRINFPTPS